MICRGPHTLLTSHPRLYQSKHSYREILSPLKSEETLNKYRGNLLDSDFSRFSSATNMLIHLNIPSLEHCRQVSSITILYNCS